MVAKPLNYLLKVPYENHNEKHIMKPGNYQSIEQTIKSMLIH